MNKFSFDKNAIVFESKKQKQIKIQNHDGSDDKPAMTTSIPQKNMENKNDR